MEGIDFEKFREIFGSEAEWKDGDAAVLALDRGYYALYDAFEKLLENEEVKALKPHQLAWIGAKAMYGAPIESRIRDVPPRNAPLTEKDKKFVIDSSGRGIMFDEDTGYVVVQEDEEGVEFNFGRENPCDAYPKLVRLGSDREPSLTSCRPIPMSQRIMVSGKSFWATN